MTSASEPHKDDDQRLTDWGREHGQAVRGYLLAMVRRADVAEDLTQETFCRAWQARDRYREEGHARAYLLRIADRLARDLGRRSGKERTIDADGWEQFEPTAREAEPAEKLQQTEAIAQLNEALETLSPVQRRVLLLRYYGQLSFSEIAQITDCPLSTALSHCHRGLKSLRKMLVEDIP